MPLGATEKLKYVHTHVYTRTKMTNITLVIPDNLKKELQKHQEVNWSAVIRKALQEHLHRVQIAEAIANKNKLTQSDVNEIASKINSSVAKKLGLK